MCNFVLLLPKHQFCSLYDREHALLCGREKVFNDAFLAIQQKMRYFQEQYPILADHLAGFFVPFGADSDSVQSSNRAFARKPFTQKNEILWKQYLQSTLTHIHISHSFTVPLVNGCELQFNEKGTYINTNGFGQNQMS